MAHKTLSRHSSITRLALATLLLGSVCASVRAAEILVHDASSLHQAIKSAVPGDIVVLKNGSWHDVELLISAAGTSDNPMTIRAQTPGQVVILSRVR